MEYVALKKSFKTLYGSGEPRIFAGPARVNLIGEHTDYNGGYVFPCALDMRSACVALPRPDGVINIASTSYPGLVSAKVSELDAYRTLGWGSYQLGVASVMQSAGYKVTGYDMLFDETVPHSSGLSSSAAIEMAMAMAIATFDSAETGRLIDKIILAQLAQQAENEYVGMNCGIMDQFASAMGRKGHAILLRCSDLNYSYVPFNIEQRGFSLVIASTNKPRSLITSKYNERRAECERALADLKKSLPGKTCLAEVTPEEFEAYASCIQNPTDRKRAAHVVYENLRTQQSVTLLNAGDLEGFGRLMVDSHHSLRDLYEVTGLELDALFEAAFEAKGVAGTRMTGAGFGGCTVSLVNNGDLEAFMRQVGEAYNKRTGLEATFFVTSAAEGAREVMP